jgi:hypothetical protein
MWQEMEVPLQMFLLDKVFFSAEALQFTTHHLCGMSKGERH